MLDRLIDLLLQWVSFFVPFVVIDDFERGVVLRFGRFNRVLEPGFHWIVPFEVDRVLVDNVVPRTMNMGAQSLTTSDGVQVALGLILTCRIHDIRKALLEVEGVDDAVRDCCYAEVGGIVHQHTWQEMQVEEINEDMLRACRRRAFQYGVEVMRVQISDLAKTRTYRLMQG